MPAQLDGTEPARTGPTQARANHRVRVADVQRARLLAAMREACAERGAANVTVAHVVGRAGVSRRTFYELFADCQDCLLAAIENAMQAAAERVAGAYRARSGARWHERIRAGLVELLCFLDAEPLMGRLLVVDTLGASPDAYGLRARALAPAIAAVDEGRHAASRGRSGRGGAGLLTPLTAEAAVGGVLAVIHARMLQRDPAPRLALANPLMSMIVLPYLGPGAARRELVQPVPRERARQRSPQENPLQDLGIRVTYRTMRVLAAIAGQPGASNRLVGQAAGLTDQGQISKLLARLQRHGLIENDTGSPPGRGLANAWRLTPRGEQLRRALGVERVGG